MDNFSSNELNRRTILASVVSAPVVITQFALANTSMDAPIPDPIIDLYREWVHANAEFTSRVDLCPDITDEELDIFCTAVVEKSDQIRVLTATSFEGLAYQIRLAWDELGVSYEHSKYYAEEMKHPENILMKSILDGSRMLIEC